MMIMGQDIPFSYEYMNKKEGYGQPEPEDKEPQMKKSLVGPD